MHGTSLNCSSFKEASDKFADYFASMAVDFSKSHSLNSFRINMKIMHYLMLMTHSW